MTDTPPGWTLDLPPEQDAADAPPTDAPPPAEEAVPPPLPRLLEALLFVGGPPLTAERAAAVLRGLTAEQYLELIAGLNRDYRRQNRPYRVVAVEGGHALALRGGHREVLRRLHGGTREARLSPAALEALAVVAYKEPLTAAEVDAVRGADSAGALRQLVRLGLVALERRSGEPPTVVYRTTGKFLDLFNLRTRDDLPRTSSPGEQGAVPP